MPSDLSRAPHVRAPALTPARAHAPAHTSPRPDTHAGIELVLREARRLHRAATSDSLSNALPVLRRLLAVDAVPARPLPGLFRARQTVQRKHLLQMLAREAGCANWAEYRRVLPLSNVDDLRRYLLATSSIASLKHWFSNEAEALQFAAEQGGQVIRVGQQAVVLPFDVEH